MKSLDYYDHLSNLKNSLKTILREKETLFKLKIEKRLYGKIKDIDNQNNDKSLLKNKRKSNAKSL